jgi:hypothetical protein
VSSDNRDENPGSRHWHDRGGVIVAQGGFWALIDAERQSGVGHGGDVDRRPAGPSLAFERDAAAVAFDIHLEDGGVVDEAIDDSDGHCLITEHDIKPPYRSN